MENISDRLVSNPNTKIRKTWKDDDDDRSCGGGGVVPKKSKLAKC